MKKKHLLFLAVLLLYSPFLPAIETGNSWRFDLQGFLLTPVGGEQTSQYFLPPGYGGLSRITRLNISQVTFTDDERLEVTFADGSTMAGVFWEVQVGRAEDTFGLVPTYVLAYIDEQRDERQIEIVIADDQTGYALAEEEFVSGTIGGYRPLYFVDFGDGTLPWYDPAQARLAP